MTNQDETRLRHRAFMAKLTAALAVALVIVNLIWDAMIPYGPLELWMPKGNPLVALAAMVPALLWGLTIQGLLELRNSKRMTTLDVRKYPLPSVILSDGARVSIVAGVFEELTFRWLLFLLFLFGYAVLNLPFRAVGINLDSTVHLFLLTPVANFFTAGLLRDALYHDIGWHVGAAMLTANALFRNGHKYQGALGLVNAWFMGMYFFWMMLTFGLPYAIVVHALYDIVVFGTVALGAMARLRGWVPVRSES